MTIKHAILGFLSREPLAGYDLKKLFADSTTLYWSGNNNQIYRALVQLHKDGLVTQEVQLQEDNPPRKVYTISTAGRAELRQWLLTTPDLPQLRHPLLIQLMWADVLAPEELDDLLRRYEEELQVALLMERERQERGRSEPARSPREAYLRGKIDENWTAFYENQLRWVRDVRETLPTMEAQRET